MLLLSNLFELVCFKIMFDAWSFLVVVSVFLLCLKFSVENGYISFIGG